jgi:hypothetical protein
MVKTLGICGMNVSATRFNTAKQVKNIAKFTDELENVGFRTKR